MASNQDFVDPTQPTSEFNIVKIATFEIPLRKFGEPEDVASAMIFLASDEG